MTEMDLGQITYEQFCRDELRDKGRVWNKWESLSPELREEWAQYELLWRKDD